MLQKQKEKLVRRNFTIKQSQLTKLLEIKQKSGYSVSEIIRDAIDQILETKNI